ncbi:P-loop containing nucleoside triphosphate hydrolase protein [Elsinoe ampelina]|uniref:P-loop containing nucleoside triphosphate hydrolase protein n=1 Tax=Elsinoe ampelina TaxID=302913 RepID=A0A6A6GAD3_9PEZI|nr:P-loop containing nucleoside triphosphate hydrolase protein [Elsinoe ampelina]
MAEKPVFVATHPRACSTAFERVFMTSRDRLVNVHEPFGDAFYFGPERLGNRYENDEKARLESGFADSTYKSVFDDILDQGKEGKRVFIKDIAHYLSPPNGKPASIAPSLQKVKRGVGTSDSFEHTNGKAVNGDSSSLPYPTEPEPGNPTVVPSEVLRQFHFAFLIRHPKHSIPSYWRCTIDPLDKITGFHNFMPEEAGYDELRRIFDYMKDTGIVGPSITDHPTNGHQTNGHSGVPITLVDADDLLNAPDSIMRKFCTAVGIEYSPKMLEWDTEEDHAFAKDKFEKWKGFHEDAINSTGLHAREHGKPETTPEQDFEEWEKKYGREAAEVIRDTVERCLPDYEYLKGFAIKA